VCRDCNEQRTGIEEKDVYYEVYISKNTLTNIYFIDERRIRIDKLYTDSFKDENNNIYELNTVQKIFVSPFYD
jgi:hypothetical protein